MAQYFVKVDGGTGSGLDDTNAWNQTYYNSTGRNLIVAGDIVKFRSGDTFGQLLLPPVNGTSGNPITITSYNSGSKPIFNTLTTLTNWSLSSGNIYYTTVDVSRLQIVTVGGVMKGMGRYPKTGYLTIGSHSGLSTVTSTAVGAIPFNPAGGEFVTRKARFIIDRHNITSRSGNTLNITSPSDFGPTGSYVIDDGNGFFIQNALGTLTQLGDWYYDKAAKRLYVHFGSGNSSSQVIQACLVNEGVNVQGKAYITLNNLDIRGGNTATINALYSANITVTNCSLSNGTEGIWTAAGGSLTSINMNFSYNSISNMFSNGICTVDVSNVTATYNTISNIHLVPGMGRSGDAIGSGMSITDGDNMVLSNNTVTNVGYCGIAVYNSYSGGGDNIFVDNNIIDNYSLNKDDAGGLYMCGNSSANLFINTRLKNNWVKNGIGNIEGVGPNYATAPFACAVYLDNYANGVNVENNLLTDANGAGIFLNSTNTHTIAYNTTYNCSFEALFIISAGTLRGTGGDETVHSLYVHDNKFIAKEATHRLYDFEIYDSMSKINNFGTFNNNTFYRPFGNDSYLYIDNRTNGSSVLTSYNIASWLSAYNKDQGSINSTVPITNTSDFRVEFNSNSSSSVVSLGNIYRDVENNSYNSQIQLAPYNGEVLIYDSEVPVVISSKIFVTPSGKILFTTTGKILSS